MTVIITGSTISSGDVDYAGSNTTSFALTTAASTARQVLTNIPVAGFRGAEITLMATRGTSYQLTKMLVIQDGTNSYYNIFGELNNNGKFASYDATINLTNLEIAVTLTTAVAATVKGYITAIKV